ncbi:MAG: hypothetical protein A2Z26_04280 [Deltaproteobacteria bacterium RBG_16_66_15]|nr:MAG: hypothetical protein A2Z26_04280 [Deltaproteobacteria bacterium RBG_16_66_15]
MTGVAGSQRQSVFRGGRRHDGVTGAHPGGQPVFLDVHERTMSDVLGQGEDRKGKIREISLDDRMLPFIARRLEKFIKDIFHPSQGN